MSQFGIHWNIDGVPTTFIIRCTANSQPRVAFERSEITPKQISRNALIPECIPGSLSESGLLEGSAFQLLHNQHASQTFTSEIQPVPPCRGDGIVEQTQIEALSETAVHDQAAPLMVSRAESAHEEGKRIWVIPFFIRL